jgi:hypothetical protein
MCQKLLTTISCSSVPRHSTRCMHPMQYPFLFVHLHCSPIIHLIISASHTISVFGVNSWIWRMAMACFGEPWVSTRLVASLDPALTVLSNLPCAVSHCLVCLDPLSRTYVPGHLGLTTRLLRKSSATPDVPLETTQPMQQVAHSVHPHVTRLLGTCSCIKQHGIPHTPEFSLNASFDLYKTYRHIRYIKLCKWYMFLTIHIQWSDSTHIF